MSKEQVATYQTRFALEDESALSACSHLFSSLERKLFADLMAKKSLTSLKKAYISDYRITARQFNSLHFQLKGKIQSAKTLQKERAKELSHKIISIEKKLSKLKGKQLFRQKNAMAKAKKKLHDLRELNKEDAVRLCFGGKKLFRSQFQAKDHAEWKKEWIEKRNNSFFSVGSKDETAGNQSCTLGKKAGKLFLRLRLPHSLESSYGKYIFIEDLSFSYGEKNILEALEENIKRSLLYKAKDPSFKELGRALSYRFVKDGKGWRVFLSVSLKKPPVLSKKELGVIGIDLNVDHLAVVETDRFGNKIKAEKIPLNLYGKTKDQALALIGDVSREIIEQAKISKKPIAIEKLDFGKKKKSLRSQSPKKARMLSSFSYNKIHSFLKAKAYREGIEVLEVNPAYTSMLGHIKYTRLFGLSIHTAAAYTIGRRGLGFFEKLPFGQEVSLLTTKNTTLLFKVPVRNPHLDRVEVLRKTFKEYKAAHVAHFRAEKIRSLNKV